ncbi:MAG: DUF456 domain-containing protein [Planctomycetaceae bacterium]
MPPDWVYHSSGVVLILLNAACWVATFFMLPGNWMMAGIMLAAAWLLPESDIRSLGIGWWEAASFLLMAAVGELLEFATGAAGAKKAGASRRSVVLSLAGAFAGSLLGASAGSAIPVPLVGTIVGALLGGGGGAFAGTYFGEAWKGREHGDRVNIGRAAFAGRMLGTVAKLIVGLGMVVATAIYFWVS